MREESESSLAVRDEIVRLVERGIRNEVHEPIHVPLPLPLPTQATPSKKPEKSEKKKSDTPSDAPRTGVEVVKSEKRKGTYYHILRDLRNGNLIKNVTRSSARKLWHYAISQVETGTPADKDIPWHNNMAILNSRTKDDTTWYDLALKENGDVHIYYGVTDSGLNDMWLEMIQKQEKTG